MQEKPYKGQGQGQCVLSIKCIFDSFPFTVTLHTNIYLGWGLSIGQHHDVNDTYTDVSGEQDNEDVLPFTVVWGWSERTWMLDVSLHQQDRNRNAISSSSQCQRDGVGGHSSAGNWPLKYAWPAVVSRHIQYGSSLLLTCEEHLVVLEKESSPRTSL